MAASGFDGKLGDFKAINSFSVETEEVRYLFGSDPRPLESVRNIEDWALKYCFVQSELKKCSYQDAKLKKEEESLRGKLEKLQSDADEAFAPYLGLE